MSNNTSKTEYKSKLLSKLELGGLIKVIIPTDVSDKIMFLCKSISRDEWSGILFYTVEGDMKDISKMSITLKDLFLMDKGTSTFTSFDWDEEIVNYRMDNPELMDCEVGHIHSH